MKIRNVTRMMAKMLGNGLMDVVDENGELLEDVPEKDVMVRSEDDLAFLPDYQPGTLAYTAGFKKIWHKAADGTWVEV